MYDELLLSMKNLIFISVFLLLPFHPGLGEVLAGIPHDFKMSVCEIVYVPENQGFDVKFYLFADDLKAAVYGNPEAAELAAEVAGNYVNPFTPYSPVARKPHRCLFLCSFSPSP
jgi:hypothetical protein